MQNSSNFQSAASGGHNDSGSINLHTAKCLFYGVDSKSTSNIALACLERGLDLERITLQEMEAREVEI